MIIDRVEDRVTDGSQQKIARFWGEERYYRARTLSRALKHRMACAAISLMLRTCISRGWSGSGCAASRYALGERTKSENSVYISRRPISIRAVHTSFAAVGRSA